VVKSSRVSSEFHASHSRKRQTDVGIKFELLARERRSVLHEAIELVHTTDMCEEVMMKALCSVLMVVGLMLALGGVVAVFNFDRPSDMFSLAWWMIVGGWSLVLIGMGIDILQLLKFRPREPSYMLQPEVERGNGVEHNVTHV